MLVMRGLAGGAYIEDTPDQDLLVGSQGDTGNCVDGSVLDPDGLVGG